QAIALAIGDRNPALRAEGRAALAKLAPERAVADIERALAGGETIEQQRGLQTLAAIEHEAADRLLASWLALLPQGKVPAATVLDLLAAARERSEVPAV